MRERQDEIAHSITLEHGKLFQQARLEVIRGAEFFEWDAGEATRTYGRSSCRARCGTSCTITDWTGGSVRFWNFPMSQPARKVAGALRLRMLNRAQSLGGDPGRRNPHRQGVRVRRLPAGVLNLVFGVPPISPAT